MADFDSKRRSRFILLIIIILLILALCFIIYYFYFFKAITVSPTNLNQSANINVAQNINLANLPAIIANVNLTPEEQEVQKNQNEVLFFAMPFAERFGTFSNEGGFRNFEELKTLMTSLMANWVQNSYVPELVKKYPAVSYYGIETKALSSDFKSLNEDQGKAQVLVKTQRIEFKGSPTSPRIFYQDIILNLVKSDNQWKVDGAYWQ
jgi:hypothetical protein